MEVKSMLALQLALSFFILLLVSTEILGNNYGTDSIIPRPIESQDREAELDNYWDKVVRTVEAGDAEGYGATFHPDGILVSDKLKTSYLLVQALEGWKKGLDATKAGKNEVSLEFRFSQRIGDAVTAHEMGIFKHVTTYLDGKKVEKMVHFEALLVKVESEWKILMEYQKHPASTEEWEALKK